MSHETSSETSHEHNESFAVEADEPNSNERPAKWVSLAALIAVLVVAGSTATFQFLSSGPDAKDEQAAPAQVGLACPHLRRAAEAYERGDRTAFEQAITRAAEIAEQTLQQSGEAFGEPERIAFELELAPDQSSARVERLLQRAAQHCRETGIA